MCIYFLRWVCSAKRTLITEWLCQAKILSNARWKQNTSTLINILPFFSSATFEKVASRSIWHIMRKCRHEIIGSCILLVQSTRMRYGDHDLLYSCGFTNWWFLLLIPRYNICNYDLTEWIWFFVRSYKIWGVRTSPIIGKKESGFFLILRSWRQNHWMCDQKVMLSNVARVDVRYCSAWTYTVRRLWWRIPQRFS